MEKSETTLILLTLKKKTSISLLRQHSFVNNGRQIRHYRGNDFVKLIVRSNIEIILWGVGGGGSIVETPRIVETPHFFSVIIFAFWD